jgi:hypothetical protein
VPACDDINRKRQYRHSGDIDHNFVTEPCVTILVRDGRGPYACAIDVDLGLDGLGMNYKNEFLIRAVASIAAAARD